MLVNEETIPNKHTIQGVPKKGVKNFLRLNSLIRKMSKNILFTC